MELRSIAREIFLVTRLDLCAVMCRKLVCRGSRLHICDSEYDLEAFGHILLIAVGKAAVPMAEGLLEVLTPVLPMSAVLQGLVIGTGAPIVPDPRLHYLLGSHPLPDTSSLEAADLTLRLLADCGPHSLVFFLISGGSSAMLERPLDPALSFEDLAAFHRTLVHSGLTIAEMNTLRKHLSAVKGGRLAIAAGEATMCTLLVSDVQPNTPDVVGSGLSLPDTSTVEDCRALLRTKLSEAKISAGIRAWFAADTCPETPKSDAEAFRRGSWHTLLSSDDFCEAASTVARAHGFEVAVDLGCDEWDYRDAAEYLIARLHTAAQGCGPQCVISAGELAVRVTGATGTGGRNQQFALECARRIAGIEPCVTVLSAGSDGIDGNSPAAGAVVDCSTLRRSWERGLNVDDALAKFDAYPLLDELGDAITIGPSANNLRDLRLLLLDGRQNDLSA